MSYTNSEPIYLLTLLNLPNIGHKTIKYILKELSELDINFNKMSTLMEIRNFFSKSSQK